MIFQEPPEGYTNIITWYRNNEPIPNINSHTYVVTAKDLGKYITAGVHYRKDNRIGKESKSNKSVILVDIPDNIFRSYLKSKIPNAFIGDKMNPNHTDLKEVRKIND